MNKGGTITINKKSKKLIKEMRAYKYPKKNQKFFSKDDHLMDAFKYAYIPTPVRKPNSLLRALVASAIILLLVLFFIYFWRVFYA